jgi:dynein heavy chain
LLQKFARKDDKSPSIDRLEFDFIPNPRPENDIQEHAKDGAYVKGLYLEGGKWNLDKQCLMEPEVMELACAMPVMHFKPKEKKGKALPGIYECPCYYYPSRGAQGSKDSFQMRIDLKTGDQPPEFWIKRGTALLMSLA